MMGKKLDGTVALDANSARLSRPRYVLLVIIGLEESHLNVCSGNLFSSPVRKIRSSISTRVTTVLLKIWWHAELIYP